MCQERLVKSFSNESVFCTFLAFSGKLRFLRMRPTFILCLELKAEFADVFVLLGNLPTPELTQSLDSAPQLEWLSPCCLMVGRGRMPACSQVPVQEGQAWACGVRLPRPATVRPRNSRASLSAEWCFGRI